MIFYGFGNHFRDDFSCFLNIFVFGRFCENVSFTIVKQRFLRFGHFIVCYFLIFLDPFSGIDFLMEF